MHWIMSRALGLDWREPLTAPQNDKPQLKSSLPKVEGAKRALDLPLGSWMASVTEILNKAEGYDRLYMQNLRRSAPGK